jgi:hypothetical protein
MMCYRQSSFYHLVTIKPNPKASELTMITAKTLTKEPPRSPRYRLGDYALMALQVNTTFKVPWWK